MTDIIHMTDIVDTTDMTEINTYDNWTSACYKCYLVIDPRENISLRPSWRKN